MTCRSRIARLAVCAALGVVVVSGVPRPAFADTSADLQAQLDDANAHLDSLYSQAADLGQELLQTQEDLDQTSTEIEQKQQDLSAAQDTLANRVSSNYKTGGVSLASLIFESTSFDDLVSRVSYASKVSESDAREIQDVRDLEAELNQKQAEQEQLLADQQSQKDELDSKTAEAEAYVSSLSQQVQDKLAEERAAYEAQQKAAQEAAQQQAQQDGGYVSEQDATQGDQPAQTEQQQEQQAAPSEQPSEQQAPSSPSRPSNQQSSAPSEDSSDEGGLTAAQREAIVAAAWSKVGGPYVYGGTGPVGYDCSGFVQYCYAQAGISLPRTSESQGGWGVGTSNPKKGDIVCWGGHVGIYMGGGMMIDAGNPRVGISYRAVYGSPWYQTKA